MRDVQYASTLKRRKDKGEALTIDEEKWYQNYKATVKRGRPRRSPPPIQNEATGAPEETPHSAGAPVDPPPIDVRSPPPEGGTQHTDEGTAHPDVSSAIPEGGGDPSATPGGKSEAHIKKCEGLALLYGQWMKVQHAALKESGMPALPEKLIDGLIVPATTVALIEYMPEGISTRGAAVVAAGSGIYTVVATRRARMATQTNARYQKPKEEKKDPQKPKEPEAAWSEEERQRAEAALDTRIAKTNQNEERFI